MLLELKFSCSFQMVGSDVGVRQHASVVSQIQFWGVDVIVKQIDPTLGALSAIWTLFKCQSLPECCF